MIIFFEIDYIYAHLLLACSCQCLLDVYLSFSRGFCFPISLDLSNNFAMDFNIIFYVVRQKEYHILQLLSIFYISGMKTMRHIDGRPLKKS